MSAHNYDICINAGGIVESNVSFDGAIQFTTAMRDSIINADVICFVVPRRAITYVVSAIYQDGRVGAVHVYECAAAHNRISVLYQGSDSHLTTRSTVHNEICTDGVIRHACIFKTGTAYSEIKMRAALECICRMFAIPESDSIGLDSICNVGCVKIVSGVLNGALFSSADIPNTYYSCYEHAEHRFELDAVVRYATTVYGAATEATGIGCSVNLTSGRYRMLKEVDTYAVSDIDDMSFGDLDFIIVD